MAHIYPQKIIGAKADRQERCKLMDKLTYGDVVIPPVADHLSRDTTDLRVIALHPLRIAGAQKRP